jgi:DNA-binding XRE family transcriptional regulator
MSVADNLRTIRNKNNVSQQDVADFLEIDRKTYVSWEAGTVDIKSSYIPKLAKFLHVEINDLFRERSSSIVINQHNTDNKNNSINGIVFLLTDKEAVDQLAEVIKEKFGNRESF